MGSTPPQSSQHEPIPETRQIPEPQYQSKPTEPIQPAKPAKTIKRSKVVTKRSPSPKPVIEEPPKLQISKVIEKNIEIPWNISFDQRQKLEETKEKTRAQFRFRFMAKVSRKEIKLLFDPSQAALNHISEISLSTSRLVAKLERDCQLDLKLFQEVLEIRLQCLLRYKLKKKKEEEQQQQQTNSKVFFQHFQKNVEQQFHQAITVLLGQAAGKTTVWVTMNPIAWQKKNKIINFLHQQGIDSSKFPFIQKPQIYRSYYY